MSDVHTCRFNPYSPGNEFVSVGNKHVKFWNGETLEGANGLFGKVGTTQQILCVAFLPSGQTLTGQLDGSIYVWEGGAIVAKYDRAHAHGVIGILYCPLGLVTVGCDSQIKVHPISASSRHGTESRLVGVESEVARMHRRLGSPPIRRRRPEAARPLAGLCSRRGNRDGSSALAEHRQHDSRCGRGRACAAFRHRITRCRS
jgi:WD40 repeat protein